MRFRLTYCNRAGNIARLDIITLGSAAVTETIEGTEIPFILTYNNDKPNKSGYFRSSSADINIYETPNFNIDTLKTSNETDIKVEWYIDDVLMWAGFVIPDFFSRQIGTPATVNMTASDRLGTLKGVTLSGLNEMVTLRSLASSCLANTGLSLPLNTYADFTSVGESDNIFDSKVYSQRLTDTKGRSISCYDVLNSILVLTNSILLQRQGEWYIYNKIQLESGIGLPELTFDEVSQGAIRSIQPVASSVGVYNEFGGGRIYPNNYSFQDNLANWNITGGLTASIENRQITTYSLVGADYVPNYGITTEDKFLAIKDQLSASEYISSDYIRIPYNTEGEVEISVDISVLIPSSVAGTPPIGTLVPFSVIARKGSDLYLLKASGAFELMTGTLLKDVLTGLIRGDVLNNYTYTTKIRSQKGKIIEGFLSDYEISIRIYGGVESFTTYVTSATFFFTLKNDGPKGNIYKTEQGSIFTKQQDIDTTILGDFITSGLNGYFYDYQIDDTSIIYDTSNNKTSAWTTPTDSDQLPILQHVARQKSRLFSIAHDILRAELDIVTFDPLTIFKDCSGKKYTLITGTSNFLTSSATVEIEEIKQDPTILKRDYIYSNFGDSDSGVKSVGGISSGSGGGGSGGGMTFEQLAILNNLADWWKLDEDGNLYSEKNVYSEKEVSAYGLSGSGTPIDGVVNLVDLWDVKPITGLTAGDILKYNGTKWVNTPESGGGGVSSWNDLTDKPTTFTPSAHTHAAEDVISGIFAIGRIPTGSTSTTVAPGNHLHTGVYAGINDSRILNGQTAYGWGNHAGLYDPIQIGLTTNLNTEFRRGQGYFTSDAVGGVGKYGVFHNTVSYAGDHDGADNWLTQVLYTVDGETYFRQKTNEGAFTSWRKVLHDKSGIFDNPTFTGTATVENDILLSGLSSPNKSLKTLLDYFEIDGDGNMVVKTNLYSLGEVTAYSTGSGVRDIKVGDYTLKEEGTDLLFYNGTTKVAKLTADGNLLIKGTITQNATL